mgnify:CR=1 FL=1
MVVDPKRTQTKIAQMREWLSLHNNSKNSKILPWTTTLPAQYRPMSPPPASLVCLVTAPPAQTNWEVFLQTPIQIMARSGGRLKKNHPNRHGIERAAVSPPNPHFNVECKPVFWASVEKNHSCQLHINLNHTSTLKSGERGIGMIEKGAMRRGVFKSHPGKDVLP